MQLATLQVLLVPLTAAKGELLLLLSEGGSGLPRATFGSGEEPDYVAHRLAKETLGTSLHVVRHGFLTAAETQTEALTLLYRQLLNQDALELAAIRMEPLDGNKPRDAELSAADAVAVETVAARVRSDLQQVIHSRLNKEGLVHLLDLLPEIFDHKELAAAYQALTGEKPPSPLMLARMMLDKYTIGRGESAREVQGRDLIREYDQPDPHLLDEKWRKNKELYRTGGPKAKKLYKKL